MFVGFPAMEPVAKWRVESGRPRWWPGGWGVAKGYRPVLRDQPMLLPVDMREWLPEDHLAWFVLETVEALDTQRLGAPVAAGRRGGSGRV